jgi:hypothetical protein
MEKYTNQKKMKWLCFLCLFVFTLSEKISAVKTNIPILTGATYLNRGFDFRQGGSIPKETKNVEIFEYTFDPNANPFSPPGRSDLKFKVPKELTLTVTGETQDRVSTVIYKSYGELLKASVGHNFGSFGIELFGIGAKYNQETKTIQERINEKLDSMTTASFTTQGYKIISRPPFLRKLHPDFLKMVELIPSNPRTPQDLERYKIALQNFGGFFQFDSGFGGTVRKHTFLNQNLTSQRSSSYIIEQTRLTFLCLNSDCRHRNGSLIQIDGFFKNNSKTDLFYEGGFSKLHNPQNISKEWKYSIDDQPALVRGNMRSIATLISTDPLKRTNFEKVIKTYSETGEIVLPSSSELKDGKQKIPGYHLLGYGFDPVEMTTKDNVFEFDSFGFEKTSTWKDEYIVPSVMKLFDKNQKEQESVNIFKCPKQYANFISMKNIKTVTRESAKRSREVVEFLQKYKTESKMEIEKKISFYELKLVPEVLMSHDKYLNPQLKKQIEKLGIDLKNKNVKKQYKELIKQYGTHITIATEIGGSMKSSIFFNHDLKNLFSKQVSGELPTVTFQGGKFKQNDNWGLFKESLKNDPEALNFEIVPISILFKDQMKSKLMDQMIEEYHQQISATDVLDEKKLFTQDEIEEFDQ